MYKSDKNKEMVSWVIQLCVYALGLSHSNSNVCVCVCASARVSEPFCVHPRL